MLLKWALYWPFKIFPKVLLSVVNANNISCSWGEELALASQQVAVWMCYRPEGKTSIVQILTTFFDKLKVYTSILANVATSDFSFFLNYGTATKIHTVLCSML